jgi:hypothetical protein
MTLAWYDPTTNRVSTDKDDPWFTPLGQVWPLDVERKWVGLTDDEVYKIAFSLEGENWRKIADAIEAKLKDRNT